MYENIKWKEMDFIFIIKKYLFSDHLTVYKIAPKHGFPYWKTMYLIKNIIFY